jgi:outer membrane receptor protein involved in Fe transport
MRTPRPLSLVCLGLALARGVQAHEPEEEPSEHEEVEVRGTRTSPSASTYSLDTAEFVLGPQPKVGDLLKRVPGLVAMQHAGGGKATQYFLRGFDADHGTDVGLFVDGVPVNMVSHAHGQGYADLNFVIPELVERIDVQEGPYSAEYGDFSTAGAIDLRTRNTGTQSQLTLGGGSFQTFRGLAIVSPNLGPLSPLLAAEVQGTNGPFERPEELTRYNLFGKLRTAFGHGGTLTLAVGSYGSSWYASGQLPLRAVERGELSRFGTLSPTDGGRSSRHSLTATYREHFHDDSSFELVAYGLYYQLALYSNFTFSSRDPVHGDQIEQKDERAQTGFRTAYRWASHLGPVEFRSTLGAEARFDGIQNGLNYTQEREAWAEVNRAKIRESSAGIYLNEEVRWSRFVRAHLGARVDHFDMNVDGQVGQNSSARDSARVSPKGAIIVSPVQGWDIHLNYGHGYHSNDARGVVRKENPVTPLTRAMGAELGSTVSVADRLKVAGALYWLDLESETVWVGDEGTTEARGASRRLGAQLDARIALTPWLMAESQLTLAQARFTSGSESGKPVPLAPPLVWSLGLSAQHPSGVRARLGLLTLADRPANENRTVIAEGFAQLEATVGYRIGRFAFDLGGQNLLNTPWREAQFANVSRLPNETGPSSCTNGSEPVTENGQFLGCEDLHFTPGSPLNIQAAITLSL